MDKLVDDVFLKRIGNNLLFIIRRRTQKGQFLPGSSPDADKYSEKPFAMPIGAANKALAGKLYSAANSKRSKLFDPDNFQTFTSKDGNLWVLIKKGYKKVRELAKKESNHTTMTWSGSYLRDLGLLQINNSSSRTEIELGWKSAENQKLATFHEIMGAGKSKRLHKIMGLLKQEEDTLKSYIEFEVLKNLKTWSEKVVRGKK
jgi:hypothetical protein